MIDKRQEKSKESKSWPNFLKMDLFGIKKKERKFRANVRRGEERMRKSI